MALERYDAVIIGSGATGGIAAAILTQRGLRVIVVEAGSLPRLGDGQQAPDSSRWQDRKRVQARCGLCTARTEALFIDDVDHPYSTSPDHEFVWIRGGAVGGRTLMWGGGTYRFSDFDFRPSQRGITGCDWPIRYDDLAVHYARCERMMGVQGYRDGIPQVPDGDVSPCVDFPLPTEFARRIELARDGVRAIGWRVVRRAETPGFEGAGVSSWESSLAIAEATGRLTLRSDAVVRRIVVDPMTDLARGVEFIDRENGTEHTVEAPIVIVCASTIETARILLNSATPRFPTGLANSSGLVGRCLMDHVYLFGFRAVLEPARAELGPAELGPRGALGFYVPWPYSARIRPSVDHRRFGIIGSITRVDQLPTLGLAAFGEVAPRPENRVTLDDKLTDRWGIPAARIEYGYSPAELEMASDIRAAFAELAEAGGFRPVSPAELAPAGLSVHEVGTARMGDDPRTSVLNRYNQSWDIENLFVLDGSAFVTSSFIQPTLTMMALASRACDYLVENLRRHA